MSDDASCVPIVLSVKQDSDGLISPRSDGTLDCSERIRSSNPYLVAVRALCFEISQTGLSMHFAHEPEESAAHADSGNPLGIFVVFKKIYPIDASLDCKQSRFLVYSRYSM